MTKALKDTTYREFLQLMPCVREHLAAPLLKQLWETPRPMFIAGEETPESLNSITYGQLDDLGRIDAQREDPFVKTFGILMDLTQEQVMAMNVEEVFGFVAFCRRELDRINGLFNAIKTTHSPEEVSAGINDLDFGTFGVVDWYARRMGITDQNRVYKVAWIRIYTCMKNDNELQEYSRRLNKAYINKQKQRRGR